LTRRNDRFPEGAPIWGLFGWFGFLLCVYLLAFPSVAEDLLRGDRLQAQPSVGALQVIYEWLPPGLALLAWAVVAWPFRPGAQNQRRPPPCGFHYWLIPLTVVLCEVLARGQPVAEKWPVASVFNLVFLALAAAWMARGCRFGLVRPTIIGSLLLVALTLARYFDLFESLAVRGLIFLTVGGLLFVEGILFKRARRRAEPQGVNT
jgi:hypothetical protein